MKTLAYYQGHSISQNPEHVGTKLAERRAFIDDAASYLSKFPTYLTHADIIYQALEMQGSRYGGGHTAVAARLRGRTMTYWPTAVLVAQDETNTADWSIPYVFSRSSLANELQGRLPADA